MTASIRSSLFSRYQDFVSNKSQQNLGSGMTGVDKITRKEQGEAIYKPLKEKQSIEQKI